MDIYIKYHNPVCKIEQHGNWIDLKSSKTYNLKKGMSELISLGVSMKLPKYYEGNIVPRSGTYGKYSILQANHFGVVDGPTDDTLGYSGNDDIWKFNAVAMKDTTINLGDRICQFKVSLTMNAPWYVKLKWIFDSRINFIEVDDLKSPNRGGYGSTGK